MPQQIPNRCKFKFGYSAPRNTKIQGFLLSSENVLYPLTSHCLTIQIGSMSHPGNIQFITSTCLCNRRVIQHCFDMHNGYSITELFHSSRNLNTCVPIVKHTTFGELHFNTYCFIIKMATAIEKMAICHAKNYLIFSILVIF